MVRAGLHVLARDKEFTIRGTEDCLARGLWTGPAISRSIPASSGAWTVQLTDANEQTRASRACPACPARLARVAGVPGLPNGPPGATPPGSPGPATPRPGNKP